MVFQSNFPSIGVGRLRLRGDEVRAYGTDKEPILRIPEDPFNKQMAAEFTKNQISIDIFASSNKYCDIAFLGTLVKYSGGFVRFVRGEVLSLSRALHAKVNIFISLTGS